LLLKVVHTLNNISKTFPVANLIQWELNNIENHTIEVVIWLLNTLDDKVCTIYILVTINIILI